MISTILLCTVLYCANLQSIEAVREIDYITVDDREVSPVVDIAERVLCNMPREVGNYDTYRTRPKQRPVQVEWGRVRVTGDT